MEQSRNDTLKETNSYTPHRRNNEFVFTLSICLKKPLVIRAYISFETYNLYYGRVTRHGRKGSFHWSSQTPNKHRL